LRNRTASSATDFMKLSSWDKQLVLALPRECAASQSDQTINPSKNEVRNGGGAGCKSPLPHLTEGRGDAFFLDILFHRMSVMAMFQQESPGNPESHLAFWLPKTHWLGWSYRSPLDQSVDLNSAMRWFARATAHLADSMADWACTMIGMFAAQLLADRAHTII